MNRIIKWFVCSVMVISLAPLAWGSEKAVAADAVKMVDKVADYLKKHGKEKTFAAVNNPKGQFVDKDLYIAIFDLDGNALAHGSNPRLIGKSLIEMRDVDGKPFIRQSIDLVKKAGKGWVDYQMTNPVTNKIEAKSTYVVETDGLMLACGVYK